MSARTFAEWKAYCAIEPFGPQADYWRAGLIASMLANVHRKKGQKPYQPEDFMPKGIVTDQRATGHAEQTAGLLRHNFEQYQRIQKVTGQ